MPVVLPTTGLANGQNQVAWMAWGVSGSVTPDPAPSGWTQVGTQNDVSTSMKWRIFVKSIGAADAGATVTLSTSGGNRQAVVGIIYSSVDLDNALSAASVATVNYTSTAARTTPALTRAYAGPVITFVLERSGVAATSFTAPSGFTTRKNQTANTGTAGTAYGAVADSNADQASGAVVGGDWVADVTGSAAAAVAIIALKPAGVDLKATAVLNPTPAAAPYTMTLTISATGGTGTYSHTVTDWGDGSTSPAQASGVFTKDWPVGTPPGLKSVRWSVTG